MNDEEFEEIKSRMEFYRLEAERFKLYEEGKKLSSERRRNEIILKFYPWVAIALPLAIAIAGFLLRA
jgi:hypothetical protein